MPTAVLKNPTLPPMIEDARGKAVSLVEPPDKEDWPKVPWYKSPKSLGQPWRFEAEMAIYESSKFGMVGGLTILPGFLLSQRFMPMLPSFLSSIVFSLIVGFSLRPLIALLVHRNRVRRRFEVRDAYLSDGRCASCGFSIEGLQQAPDGCITCPECSACWIPRSVDQKQKSPSQ